MIPHEAVEAAAKALWVRSRIDSWEDARVYLAAEFRADARAALESAAPRLMRAAWDEGNSAGWDAARGEPEEPNPYEDA